MPLPENFVPGPAPLEGYPGAESAYFPPLQALGAAGSGVLGAQPLCQQSEPLSVRDQWARIKDRIEWIQEQFNSMERDHARAEGRGESRPLFSSIKALALIALMRSALAVLDELSRLIPA